MQVRPAKEKDIEKISALLRQVLQVHAAIRPDVFINNTAKYTPEQLAEILQDETRPIFVAVDEDDTVLGYAFCQIQQQPFSTNMVPFQSVYIDDLCVDESLRGQKIGQLLFGAVKDYARQLGCYEITLNVWEGNDRARSFYDRMGMKVKETTMELILD